MNLHVIYCLCVAAFFSEYKKLEFGIVAHADSFREENPITDSNNIGENPKEVSNQNLTANDLANVFRKKIQNLKRGDEVELVILVDGSYSVGAKNFFSEIKFIRQVVSDVEIGPEAIRLGVVIYSTHAVIHVDHLSITDPTDLEKCSLLHFDIPSISYPGLNTNTKEALEKAEKILTRARNGSSKVVFLLTDGFSNMGNPLQASDILKEQGIEIFTFGIRNGNVKELKSIASQPVDEHSFLFDSFGEFEGFVRRALHEDLSPGSYVPAKNSTSCNHLCQNQNGCCSPEAICSCGLISGHFACTCPPGYYGSGLEGEGCTLCPEGTYSEGLLPGDALTCTPCPDVYHITSKYPATSKTHCVCGNGTVADGDRCKIVSCPILSPPMNGYFVKKNCSNAVNAACGVRCHWGHILVGSSVRICQKNGTWSGIDPICRPKSCEGPKPVSNSMVTCINDDDDPIEKILRYDANGQEILTEEMVSNELSLTSNKREAPNFSVGTMCNYSCSPGYFLVGSKSRSCLPMLKWSGLRVTCKSIRCPSLPQLPNGSIKPSNCTEVKVKHTFGSVCRPHCNPGYELKGPKLVNCTGKHGKWSGNIASMRCFDVEPPDIECPKNLTVKTDVDVHFATVKLKLPNTTDNSGEKPIIWSKPPFEDDSPLRLIIGKTEIEIYSVDVAGNYEFCSFTVEVKDEEEPKVLECLSPPVFFISESSSNSSYIWWKEPVFDDNSGIPISVSRTPHGYNFPVGTTSVTYTATDAAGNTASCSINITVLDDPCSLRPSDGNTLWKCDTYPEEKKTVCHVSCSQGFTFATEIDQNYIVLNCTFFGRKAFWEPNIFGEDVDLFPECSEIIEPDEIINEITFEDSGDLCDDLYASNEISKSLNNGEDKLVIECEDDIDDFDTNTNDMEVEDAEMIEEEWPTTATISNVPQISTHSDINSPNNTLTNTLGSIPNDIDLKENELSTTEMVVSKSTEIIQSSSYFENTITETIHRNTKDTSIAEVNTEPSSLIEILTEGNQYRINEVFMASRKKRSPKKGRKRVRIRISHKGTENQKKLLDSNKAKFLNVIRKFSRKQGEEVHLPNIKTTILCTIGSILKNNACVKCPKGSFYDLKRSTCRPCPIGSYQEDEGKLECTLCPEGYSTRKIRRKNLKQCKRICPPGTFGRKMNNASLTLAPCTVCPVGSYQNSRGSRSCESCPIGFTTRRSGSDNSNLCISLFELTNLCNGINCRNGGTCHQYDGLAFCECVKGFEGSFCERKFDACESRPCYNGGLCEMTEKEGYICHCPSGFQGRDCEFEVDECLPDPCNGHGECTDLLNAFRCDCMPGYKGQTCNETIDICKEFEPCINGGTCLDAKDVSYICLCQKGFSGRHCDVEYECSTDDCKNDYKIHTSMPEINATCARFSCPENGRCQVSTRGKPTCVCLEGFRGPNCTVEINNDVILRFPKYGVTEYLITDFPEGNYKRISICVWIETKDTFNYGTIFSYATLEEDNAFTLTDYSGLVLYVLGQHVVTDLEANDGRWHFLCVTWEGEEGQWQVFLDGSFFSKGFGLSKGASIAGGGKLVVGQEQDSLGGGFNDVESFSGRITQFDVWNTVLEPSQIKSLYENCEMIFGDLISWTRLLQGIRGKIIEEDSMFCRSCNSSLEVYRGKVSYDLIDQKKVAKYECDEGFIIKFDSNDTFENQRVDYYHRKCMKFGDWHFLEPKCKRISCGFPGYFPEGTITGRSYDFGDKIIYSCLDGYSIEGNDTRICLADGTWSGRAPRCQTNVTECKKLLAPRHGAMFVHYDDDRDKPYSSHAIVKGDRAEFICDSSYVLVGFRVLTCTEGGFWDRKPPTCEKIKCPLPMGIFRFVSPDEVEGKTFYLNDSLTITCPAGPVKTIACGVHGTWNFSENICENECSNKPISIKNGYALKKLKTGIIRVACLPGFRLEGDNIIKCSENGTWIQSRPTVCHRIFCETSSLPEGYLFRVSEPRYFYGQNIIVECPPGKILADLSKNFVECHEDGKWSSAPECL